MTKANHSVTGVSRLIGLTSDAPAPAVRMGEWVFTPASARFDREANATLHDKDRCIDLLYSSSVLEDFLVAMGSIENDFVTLASSADVRLRHGGQQTGQSFHA